jgi:phage gp29-like protein
VQQFAAPHLTAAPRADVRTAPESTPRPGRARTIARMWNPFRRKPQPAALQLGSSMAPPEPLPDKVPRRGIVAASLMPPGEWINLHPGRGLSADMIRLAFDAAEAGRPQRQCDVFDDVLERDGHLRSLCDSRLQSVAGKSWIMQAGGDEDADSDAALALEKALRRLPNLPQTFEHLLTATLYGYAPVEIEWGIVDGLIAPVWLANVPHRRIIFVRETDEPRLVTESAWRDGLALERGKWIFASMRHRTTARGGLLRAATWYSWLKSLSLRDWRIFSARFGIPFVIGRHHVNADEETIDQLKVAIAKFGLDGGAVFTEEADVEIKEPVTGSNATVHPALVSVCNAEMSKVIQGATLTSGEGTSAGSYALGKVHENAAFNFTLADAERLSGWFHELCLAFCHFNNLTARPPRLKLRVVREVDLLQRAQIADIYVNKLGGSLDDDQFRDEYDFKRPTGGVPLEGPRVPPPTPGAPSPDAAPAGEDAAPLMNHG